MKWVVLLALVPEHPELERGDRHRRLDHHEAEARGSLARALLGAGENEIAGGRDLCRTEEGRRDERDPTPEAAVGEGLVDRAAGTTARRDEDVPQLGEATRGELLRERGMALAQDAHERLGAERAAEDALGRPVDREGDVAMTVDQLAGIVSGGQADPALVRVTLAEP